MTRKLISLLLALVLIFALTACGSTTTTDTTDEAAAAEGVSDAETAQTEDAADGTAAESETDAVESETDTAAEEEVVYELPEEAKEDVVSYLTDGAYTSDTVVASAGASGEMTMQNILYQAADQYTYANYMYSMYGMELDLTSDSGSEDGTNIADYLYNYGRSNAVDVMVAAAKAQELDLTLSEDDEAGLETLTADNIAAGGESLWEYYVENGVINEDDYDDAAKEAWIQEHGTEYYNAYLMMYGVDTEGYLAISRDYCYMNALWSYLFDEGGEYEMTEDEIAEQVAAYVEDNGCIWGRCILFSTTDAEDDAAVEEIAATAQSTYEELSALSGEELSEAFTEKQTEYDESGYTAGEVQYYTLDDSLVDGFYDTLAGLSVGQVGISELTDYGYFILLREEDNTADIEDTVVSDYEGDIYYGLLDQWISDYGVDYTTIAADVDTVSLFTKMGELYTIVSYMDFS